MEWKLKEDKDDLQDDEGTSSDSASRLPWEQRDLNGSQVLYASFCNRKT